ncbi:hypothetical protein [Streptomyces sp. NPDC014006]
MPSTDRLIDELVDVELEEAVAACASTLALSRSLSEPAPAS